MAISGQVNLITSETEFFAPILLGSGKPTSGFAPLTGQSFQISMLGVSSSTPHVHPVVPANINPADGTFLLPEFPASSDISAVALNLVHIGQPFYRSQVFNYARAK